MILFISIFSVISLLLCLWMVHELDSEDNKNTESRAGYEPVSILIIVKKRT